MTFNKMLTFWMLRNNFIVQDFSPELNRIRVHMNGNVYIISYYKNFAERTHPIATMSVYEGRNWVPKDEIYFTVSSVNAIKKLQENI